MTKNRTNRVVIASIVTVLWLGYMVVGLALISQFAPTEGGQGPAGLAAFVGLVTGLVTCGFIMWAASE